MKTVIITGASKGIGAEIATLFAENGYNVVINYFKHELKAKNLCNKLLKMGANAIYCKADVSNEDDVKMLVNTTLNTFKSIDVLINNAGISKFDLVQDTSLDDLNKLLSVNSVGTFLCCKHAVKNMISNKCGKIINISSMWGLVGSSMETAYSMSKSAIISFTKGLAKELGPSNINVNCICPGVINTDMIKDLSEDTVNTLKENTPLLRIGTPKDVANLALFLASDEASFITGQVISVDGGITL